MPSMYHINCNKSANLHIIVRDLFAQFIYAPLRIEHYFHWREGIKIFPII
jgi:hypothetical protein